MYTIGQFASFGHVSARRLRHYDAIGLLQPAYVDERTGYRLYTEEQLPVLLRIALLRDLGCSLTEVGRVIRARDVEAATRRALRQRQRELEEAVASDISQLRQVEEYLQSSGMERAGEVAYKSVAPVAVYAAHGVAREGEGVSATIAEVLPTLRAALDAAGAGYADPTVFWYEPIGEAGDIRVWLSWTAVGEPVAGEGYEIVHLPAIERAASLMHRGPMSEIAQSWRRLAEVVAADGEEFEGLTREVCVAWQGLPGSDWLTEIQQPVAASRRPGRASHSESVRVMTEGS